MQDLHAVGDGGGCGGGEGRFFGGGGGDRRFRPHNHLNNQALKCPRCESLNTKFCYYNNYNLSQPRHFCKACRRYWTKGGVLRSVPVGGGCRKAKRSKPRSSAGAPDAARERKSKSQSTSSTDSSSLTGVTAATPTSATAAAADEGSAPTAVPSTSASAKYSFTDATPAFFSLIPPANANFDDHQPFSSSTDGRQIFTEIDILSDMVAPSKNATANVMSFNPPTGIPPASTYGGMQQPAAAGHNVNDGLATGITDAYEFKMQDVNDGLATALNWGSGGGGCGDQGIYDLTAALDPAYWNQPQWNENDHSLNYLP